MSEISDERLAAWFNKWENDQAYWHKDEVHANLVKYFHHIKPSSEDGQILVPLCGKSLDLKWLYDQGCQVIGVEGCEKPVLEFFSEHNLPYNMHTDPSISAVIFKTKDERLKIYCGNFFTISENWFTPVDSIWDRGSLVAINKEDRAQYGKIMKNITKPKSKYLLEIMNYDDNGTFQGPPRAVPDEVVQNLYGDQFNIEFLEKIPWESERAKQFKKEHNLTFTNQSTILLSKLS